MNPAPSIRLLLPLLMALCSMAPTTSAEVTIDWVTVGGPGNVCDTQPQGCFGSVAETFQIAKFEVTNTQYAEFLSAVAATDSNALYNTSMGSGSSFGGITRSGSPGSYSYSATITHAAMPVNWVSFWDAVRFANWLHNGQPTGGQDNTTTEDGAYTLTPTAILNNTVTRNAGAQVFAPSEDEWYKAAYYDAGALIYFDYPAGTDTQTTCGTPGAAANTANCQSANGYLTNVGSYTGSASPHGTFDQGGNVSEWNEAIISLDRGVRGGDFFLGWNRLAASSRIGLSPTSEDGAMGFRVASSAPAPAVPSMGPTGVATLLGLLVAIACRRLRASPSSA